MGIEIPIWVHQIDSSYVQAEIGIPDEGRPFSEIWPKTHDGQTMMSRWDSHPLAISGPQALANMAEAQAAARRNLRPWCVVSGLDPVAEGRLCAQMAVAAASHNLTGDRVIIIDLEPWYAGGKLPNGQWNPQFWRSDVFSDGPARARLLLDTFQQAAGPGSTAWIAGDVREQHLAAVSYDAWASHPVVSLHTPQTYYTIFDANPNTPLERAIMWMDEASGLLNSMGVESGRIGHILPTEGNPAVFLGAYAHAHDQGEQRPSGWQRINITEALCEALKGAADPWATAAPSPPVQGPNEERRAYALAQLRAIGIAADSAAQAVGSI